MSDETTLLPCPFCGGESRVYEDDDGDWRVYCRDGLTYGCLGYWTIDRFYPTEAEAIAAWNTRAERTCKMRADGAHCMNGVEFYECRSCGEYACIPTVMGKSEPPNYCPNCGAKVVGE